MRALRHGLAMLVVLLVVVNSGRAVALAAGPARHATLPAVSPDDRTIAVTHGDSTRKMQVWAIDVTHAQAHPLAAFPADQGRPQWPAWSADGKRVAVQAGHDDRQHPEANESDVFVVEVATGAVQRVTSRDRAWLDETPSWCPDGKHFVIQSTRTGAFELWRIAAADRRGGRRRGAAHAPLMTGCPLAVRRARRVQVASRAASP